MIERIVPAGQGWAARVRCSERADGDFRCDGAVVAGESPDRRAGPGARAERGARLVGAALDGRRQALMAGRWTWLHQVHGAEVVPVRGPGANAGAVADGAVTTVAGAVLAVHTADCTPVVVAGGGALGVAHAGWRGIAAGIVGATVRAVLAESEDPEPRLVALLGPMIRPASYEFGAADLASVAAAVGCDVTASTAWGTPALDLAAAARGALQAAGVSCVEDWGIDTAAEQFFSHRVRGDVGRQALAARLEPAR